VKLFEVEKLEEGVAYVKNIHGIAVSVSDHVHDRMQTRTAITQPILNQLINRIPDVRNKIKKLETRQQFKIWSKSLQLGLGMLKGEDKDGYMRVLVGTVLDKPLFDKEGDMIFYVG
jgi:hypothetical protein